MSDDHVLVNRGSWDEDAPNWIERGREAWTRPKPVWGRGNPESELGVLPGVSGLDADELGCGTAYFSAWLTRRGARVVGLDNSRPLASAASKAWSSQQLSFEGMNLHEHWEEIYTSRPPDVVSWYEPVPLMSRKLVVEACQEGAESVIDVGGGASSLVDELLELGVKRVAVLDISEAGLAVSKRRLGSRARRVEWIVGDVTTVEDIGPFDVWHDRAVFHFLTGDEDRRHYVRLAEHTLPRGGTAIMATFAWDGPARCSGLEVRRYDPGQLAEQCGPGFELIQSKPYVHTTPSGSQQSFLFATFHRVVGNR